MRKKAVLNLLTFLRREKRLKKNVFFFKFIFVNKIRTEEFNFPSNQRTRKGQSLIVFTALTVYPSIIPCIPTSEQQFSLRVSLIVFQAHSHLKFPTTFSTRLPKHNKCIYFLKKNRTFTSVHTLQDPGQNLVRIPIATKKGESDIEFQSDIRAHGV